MDADNNEQTELLRNIWGEMKALGANLGGRIDQTNERLDQTNERLESLDARLSARIDHTNEGLERTNEGVERTNERLERLERRQVSMETRLATELVGVVGAVHELRDAVLLDRKHREVLTDHEQRIGALESKSG